MAYCKFCGIESKTADFCELCRRPLPPVPVTPVAPPPPQAVEDKLEAIEEKEQGARRAFFIACGALILVASILILLCYRIFPWVIVGALFAAGMLPARFRIIQPFESAWVEFGILFVLVVTVPGFFLFLGYVIYGLITKNLDEDLAWLLGVYVGVLTILEITAFIAFPDRVPNGTLIVFRAVEVLGFAAAFGGWIVDSSLGPMDR